jgi:hypothetical protein
MLESSNSTANGGNMSQVSGGLQQPFAQIQQFNQDTGNGPICCKIAGSSPGLVNAATDTTAVPPITDDTTDVATTNDEEEVEEDSNRNDEEEVEEDSNRNDEEENNDNDDNDGGSGSIMDQVEDTMRESGIDFSFD